MKIVRNVKQRERGRVNAEHLIVRNVKQRERGRVNAEHLIVRNVKHRERGRADHLIVWNVKQRERGRVNAEHLIVRKFHMARGTAFAHCHIHRSPWRKIKRKLSWCRIAYPSLQRRWRFLTGRFDTPYLENPLIGDDK